MLAARARRLQCRGPCPQPTLRAAQRSEEKEEAVVDLTSDVSTGEGGEVSGRQPSGVVDALQWAPLMMGKRRVRRRGAGGGGDAKGLDEESEEEAQEAAGAEDDGECSEEDAQWNARGRRARGCSSSGGVLAKSSKRKHARLYKRAPCSKQRRFPAIPLTMEDEGNGQDSRSNKERFVCI